MPLNFATQPQDGLGFVDKHLDDYKRRRNIVKSSPQTAQFATSMRSPTRPTLKAANGSYAPHPVYFMVIEDLLPGGAGLDAARSWGHYYVLENNHRKPFARAHVVPDETGQLTFKSLSFGTYSQNTVPALEKLAIHDQVLKGSYEVRSLRCKHIFLAAIWLKALDGGDDLIHPLEEEYYLLEGVPPYTAVNFITALRPVAQRFLAGYQAFGNQLKRNGTSNLAP